MKKTKLNFNFFSAAQRLSGIIAVLFTPAVAAPVRARVPYFPRR